MDVDVDNEPSSGVKRKAADDLPSLGPPKRIRALEQDVVNKIAAGEIIVAPVNALKELTENAVDAGSTSVEILVKDGGLKLLQITDNGHGINRDDLPILCERFTTSKLHAFEDLTSIGTYGFRGEALASISHIAHLQVTTKTKDSSCAWRAHYSDGKLVPAKPGQSADPKACAGRQGTQITVEDLFYNVPSRRRAFRSASEEYTKILDMIGRYAIHCTGVAFTSKKHGDASMGISVPSNATTIERVRQIHGSSVANELIEFEAANSSLAFRSNGWISNANYHVKRLILLLFINNRSVESSAIKKVVEQTYSTFLPKGGHPFVYLSIHIDPQRVDVNVHPTKREVNFLNEDEITENICDEIRARLGKVDNSRTLMTQSLLPGVRIPTISASSTNEVPKTPNAAATHSPNKGGISSAAQLGSAVKPHESNLVRTDARMRKITTMLPQSQRTYNKPQGDGDQAEDDVSGFHGVSDAIEYEQIDREPKLCRLASVKELRASVRDATHNGLTDVFSTHTFVGIVDDRRRIAAIQSGVKLYLVDYGLVCNEFFYQTGLTDFGNFGSIRLDPPLPLDEILRIAASAEKAVASESMGADDNDWDDIVTAVGTQLIERRDMLAEYFNLEISESGDLVGLPLLVKGYTPSLAKLPRFLLRLGPHVDWTEEKACFRTLLRELASWYVPEALPPLPRRSDRAVEDGAEQQDGQHGEEEDEQMAARRAEIERAVEHILFPAFKARLVATKGLLKSVVEVADLKGLYRVFERC